MVSNKIGGRKIASLTSMAVETLEFYTLDLLESRVH